MTETVQVPPAGMVAFEKVIEPLPATGAKVGEPQLEMVALGVEATTMLPGVVGKVSVKATLVRLSLGFGLVMEKVNVLTSPARMGLGVKSFEILGALSAVNEAVAEPVEVEFVPLSVVEMKPLTLV